MSPENEEEMEEMEGMQEMKTIPYHTVVGSTMYAMINTSRIWRI